jgi:uncharacterized protein YjiS (DUF1127 family)
MSAIQTQANQRTAGLSIDRISHWAKNARRQLHWNEITQKLRDWQTRGRSCKELQSLEARLLRDIGVWRRSADYQIAKLFWTP